MKIRPVDRPPSEIWAMQLITPRVFACGGDVVRILQASRVSPHMSHARMRLRTEMDSSTADGRDARDHKEASMHG